MDALQEMLYKELRQAEQEVFHSLQKKNCNHKIKPILVEELNDLRTALKKIENGKYGLCEISGELIPSELLHIMPTLKSTNDLRNLEAYCRKPLHIYS